MPSKNAIGKCLDNGIGLLLIGVLLAAAMAENLYAVSTLVTNTVSMSVQLVVAATCVLLEPVGFVKARQCWRAGRPAAASGMVLLTFIAIAVSLSNEAAFYKINFANKAQTLASKVDVAHDTAKEKAEIEKRLADAGNVRPAAAIKADITLALAKPAHGDRYKRSLDRATRGCTNTRSAHYDECGKVLELRKELETSAGIGPQIAKDRERLEVIRSSQTWVTTIGVIRPGAALVADVINGVRAYFWHVPEDRYISDASIQTALIVLVMAALQLANIILPFAWFGNTPKATSDIPHHHITPSDGIIDDERVRSPADDDPTDASDKPYRRLWISAHPIFWSLDDLAKWTANDAAVDVVDNNVNVSRNSVDVPAERADVATEAFENVNVDANVDVRPATALVIDLKNPKVAAVAAFRARCCVQADGLSQMSGDLYAAYASVTPSELRFKRSQFTRVFRNLPGFPPLQHHRVDGRHWHIMGVRLNNAWSFATAS